MLKYILVNYNHTPEKWWDGDYLIYDRSDDGIDHLKDFDQSKIIYTDNMGQVDYDKLSYLVDNYDNLPDVFFWGKTNLFKEDVSEDVHVSPHVYMTRKEWEAVKDNKFFTPVLTQHHECYSDILGQVCYYSGGMFYERSNLLLAHPWKYFKDYPSFAHAFQIPCEYYVPFAPGGNYILTKETVHKYSRDYYDKMRSILPYAAEPAEAYWCERCYYTIWK